MSEENEHPIADGEWHEVTIDGQPVRYRLAASERAVDWRDTLMTWPPPGTKRIDDGTGDTEIWVPDDEESQCP